MIQFNYNNKEIVSSPTIILSGSCSIGTGVIEVSNNGNSSFPPQYGEINNYNFKVLVHLSPNENHIKVNVMDNGSINEFGFPVYKSKPRILESSGLELAFYPLDNKPVHLCLIVGKDSPGTYDMPQYRLRRGEVSNIETAVKKLKVAGRIMQAYTHDEMRSNGFSNRTFQFVEESVQRKTIFGYNDVNASEHSEVKVHILRSPKTVAELRDPNLAQQNSKGTNTGGLFSHAIDVIRNTPEIFSKKHQFGTCVQCAVIYLDAHYDAGNDLILTHAALGGGNADVKLAIFGSHGLHSWPISFPMVVPSFLDQTHLSKREVANDANQCGTSWECLNITMGAFMHEIGHSLGCPHQVDGVMLRDYIWWNRAFMTRELQCLRTKTSEAVIPTNGQWQNYCHWNIMDKIRFLFHGSFALPIDGNDKTMGHTYTTTLQKDSSYHGEAPTLYNTPNGNVVKSGAGIFMIELVAKDLSRVHIPYYPRTYGGQGMQHELVLDYNALYDQLRCSSRENDANFDVRILSLAGDLYIKKFREKIGNSTNIIRSDFGLGRGTITGYKSNLLGKDKGKGEVVIGFDNNNLTKIRVFHGGALDGIRFYYNEAKAKGNAPPVPARNYMAKIANKVSGDDGSKSVLLGKEKSHYTDINVTRGDRITKMNFRNGAWVDAIQFEFQSGTKTAMLGNATGGHLSSLEPPGQGYTLVGMYGYVGSWMDGIGIIYTNDI